MCIDDRIRSVIRSLGRYEQIESENGNGVGVARDRW